MRKLVVLLVFLVSILVPIGSSAQAPVQPEKDPGSADFGEGKMEGNPIRLRAGTFVPTRGESLALAPELQLTESQADQAGYYLVQFQGPIRPEWKERFNKQGGILLDYIPDFAYIAYIESTSRATVQVMPEVAWMGIYQPAYKINPDLAKAEGQVALVILTFPTESLDSIITEVKSAGAAIRDTSSNNFGGLLRVEADASTLTALAQIPAVHWIEPDYERILTNDVARADAIMGAETVWSDLGLYGQGQTVAVADTGLDTGSLTSLHNDFRGGPTGCTGTSRVIATYGLGRPGDWSDSCYSTLYGNQGGHGTHVAGSVLGNGCESGSSGTPDYSGSHAGLAPQANLVFQSIMDSTCSLGGLPNDLNDLYSQAAGDGATIHTNSWGAGVYGQYTTDSYNTDVYAWNNKGFTILFAASNDGIDADSDGRVDLDSLGAPATAKNCITVGATENDRPYGGVNPEHSGDPWDEVQCSGNGGGPGWGNCWPDDFPTNPILDDYLSDDSTGMAAFSSRGPTDDGRIKPDVVAPGTNILSTKSQATYVGGGWGDGENQYYLFMGGTSMATPLTAGGTALVRQFYTDLESITPSSALIKATLINSAVNIYPGQYGSPVEQWPDQLPNNVQGWGRVNVNNATDSSHQYVDLGDGSGLDTGEYHEYNYTVCTANVFKVTLVWTDYPGSTASDGALVNDLDLTVTAPDGTTTYLGNVFSSSWSTTGGSVDRTNNVESVYIQTPTAGDWTVKVTGYNVPQGTRPGYALVVDIPDNVCDPDFTINAAPASLDVCAPNDATFNVTVGQLVGFSDPVDLSTSGRPAGTSEAFSVDPVTPPGSSVLTIGSTGAATAGTYNIDVTGTSGTTIHQDTVTLDLYSASPSSITLTAPTDGSTGQSATPTFSWSTVAQAVTYEIQIATDAAFNTIIDSTTGLTTASYTPASALNTDTIYYWRVRAVNPCGNGAYSAVWAFRTEAPPACSNLILNGDFEAGQNGNWTDSSGVIGEWEVPYAGTWYAYFGGYANANEWIEQTVTIPNGATGSLTYYYSITSDENKCDRDAAGLLINGVNINNYALCSTNNTPGSPPYTQEASIDMSSYAGSSVPIRFWTTTNNNATKLSRFRIDNVEMTMCTDSTPVSADYSDLASSYGIAWHEGGGDVRLGSNWTADSAFGDGVDDSDDDGVSHNNDWKANTSVTLQITINCTGSCSPWVAGWADWNGDGEFADPAENIIDEAASEGVNNISFTVPASFDGGLIQTRFRVYDSQPAPMGSVSGAQTSGGTSSGEVEDYAWNFIPTVGPLSNFAAKALDAHILVGWQTSFAGTNVLGFNLYRATSPDGKLVKLNADLIPTAFDGYPYAFADEDVDPGVTYYYWLEIASSDDKEIYGPSQATAFYTVYLPISDKR